MKLSFRIALMLVCGTACEIEDDFGKPALRAKPGEKIASSPYVTKMTWYQDDKVLLLWGSLAVLDLSQRIIEPISDELFIDVAGVTNNAKAIAMSKQDETTLAIRSVDMTNGHAVTLSSNAFEYEQATLIRRYSVYPRFSVRVGSLRKIFGEFRFGEGFADAFPGSQFQILTGYGFHSESGAAMRLGTSSNAGIILSGSVPAGDRVLIESFLGVGKSLFNHYDSESNFQGSFRIAYRIGYQWPH